jgi:hypothetical protein
MALIVSRDWATKDAASSLRLISERIKAGAGRGKF